MFSREGYIPLSQLWRDFENRFLPACKTHALRCLRSDPHGSAFMFGTALDLCEDAFLKTFDVLSLSLVPLKGEVVQVDSVIARSGAKLLLKATAFESAHISMRPDEAGQDGKWLRQMGSATFQAADLGWLSPDRAGRDTGPELEKTLFSEAFQTLPILFERSSFVIAQELPPWSSDLIEEAFVQHVWRGARGSAICLTEAAAKKWGKTLSVQSVNVILKSLLPDFGETSHSVDRSSAGRPSKMADVTSAYQELEFIPQNLARKEELRRIESHLNMQISASTLDRVRRKLR